MKDSRIGTYGSVGLGLALAVKFMALVSLDSAGLVVPALLVAHCWSRLLSISYLADLSYARDEEGKSKPLSTRIGSRGLRFALLSALPLVLLISLWQAICVALVLLAWRAWFGQKMKQRLGGYTGDTLGAAQQIAELAIYLTLAALAGG
jgi:adenosylcobinamide-GDP ribazoletransferase